MLLSVNSLKKSFGTELLFDDVSFSVDDGDKIGFVGANGAGKSTLLKLLLGESRADSGEVFKNKFTKIGYLDQYACGESGNDVFGELLEAFGEQRRIEEELDELQIDLDGAKKGDSALIERHARLSDRYAKIGGFTYKSRIKSTLAGLGFSEEECRKKVSDLSGGQKTRVSLAKILLSDCNLLFLDEPTNHLDIDSTAWLEDFIRSSRAAFLIVSHDRYFLDRVTNRTFSLENGRFYSMNLPYSQFHAQRELERLTERRSYDNTMREIERLEGVIEQQRRWNREKNIKTAESKQKVVDRLREGLSEPDAEQKAAQFTFGGNAPTGGDDVLSVDGAAKSFDGRRIFKNASLHIRRGERVFLLGPNGCGKTTLLKIALGLTEPDAGSIRLGANIAVGYYDQIGEFLSPEKTVIDEVWDEFPTLTETKIRNALAAFLFRGEEVLRQIRVLSGGERARVELTKLALRSVNFLILDEPTNHLDIASREALEEALAGFPGTILSVSHDRYFINRLATRVCYMTEGGIESFDGNYDFFAEKFRGARAEVQKTEKSAGAEDWREQKAALAQKRKAENDSRRAEAEIARIEAEIADKNALLADSAVATDYLRAAQITDEIAELTAALDAQYALWESAQEKI